MTLSQGTRLGPYRIEAPIGAGGMGAVYRAHDTRLDRTVAIKVLSSELAGDAQLLLRFEREAKTISSLNHPNICTLFDVGETRVESASGGEDIHYLVMEHIEGQTLADRLEKGPLPIDEVIRRGSEIADALDRAHRHGIVHRDIKPGNIMLTRSGAKLLDFGLSRFQGDGPQMPTDDLTAHKPLTQEGTILGTWLYMAPEQLDGAVADARTDIFAFGCVLYEMTTGRRAFEGKSRSSLIAAIVSSQPRPLSEFQPLAPPALEQIIRKCLEKDPEERWQSVRDLRSALQWLGDAGSQVGVPRAVMRSRRARLTLTTALAIFLALTTAAATWVAVRSRSDAGSQRRVAMQITPPPDHGYGNFRLSPNGSRIAFVSSDDTTGVNRLAVRDLDSTEVRELAGTEHLFSDFWCWSPRGDAIAFIKAGRLYKVSLAGGTPIRLNDTRMNPRGEMSWSTDGMIYFAPQWGSSIHSVPETGGRLKPVTVRVPKEREHRKAYALPAGRLLFHVWNLPGGENDDGVYWTAPGSDTKTLVMRTGASIGGGSVWHYQNGWIVRPDATNPQRWLAQKVDLGSMKLEDDPQPIDFDAPPSDMRMADDGTVAVMRKPRAEKRSIAWFDRTGARLETVDPTGTWTSPTLSPDGNRLIVIGAGRDEAEQGVWVWDLIRGSKTRVAAGSDALLPIWSNDGQKVVYGRFGSDVSQVIAARADGGGTPQTILQSSELSFRPLGMTDANEVTVLEQVRGAPTRKLRLVSLDSPFNSRVAFETDMGWARVSRDGTAIAYEDTSSAPAQIYIQRIDDKGLRVQVSAAGGQRPRWRSDGKELFYVTPAGDLMAVPVTISADGIEAGNASKLFRLRSNTLNDFYDVTHDGTRIIASVIEIPDGGRDHPPLDVFINRYPWLTK